MEVDFFAALLVMACAVQLVPPTPANGQWIESEPKYACPDRPLYPCNCTSSSDEGIQLKCNNTNIASLAVGLSQVRTLIHKLDISECNMEKLYGDIFKHKTIKVMRIEDTPIKDIREVTIEKKSLAKF